MKKKYRFDIKLMMADCEANYARVCRLLPAVLLGFEEKNDDASRDSLTLEVDLATDKPAELRFSIRERCRFTTTVNIQVRVESFGDLNGEPGCVNMSVRLYHDVNMAEVIACNKKPNRLASYEYPNESMFQPDEKAQQNRFLSEWLGLCLKHGLSNTLAYSTSVPHIPEYIEPLRAATDFSAANLAADI